MGKIPHQSATNIFLISAIVMVAVFGVECNANRNLWNHGAVYDAIVSSFRNSVEFKQGDEGRRIQSVMIFPDFFPDEKESRIYLYGDNDTLRRVSGEVADIYAIKGDTLYWTGIESRSDEAKPDSPVAICRLPLDSCGQTLTSYSGKMGYWGNRPVKRIYGESRSTVTNGIDMTVEADTLHDVTMLEWDIEMRMERDTSSLIPGSLVFEDDAIDKTVLFTRRKAFFAPTATRLVGYPIMTRTDTYVITCKDGSEKDTVPLGSVSRWIPELTAAAAEQERVNKISCNPNSLSEDGYFPIRIASQRQTGDELAITLSTDSGAERVTAVLCTVDGIVLGSSHTFEVTGMASEYRIPMPADHAGVMLLRLETESANRTVKVIR